MPHLELCKCEPICPIRVGLNDDMFHIYIKKHLLIELNRNHKLQSNHMLSFVLHNSTQFASRHTHLLSIDNKGKANGKYIRWSCVSEWLRTQIRMQWKGKGSTSIVNANDTHSLYLFLLILYFVLSASHCKLRTSRRQRSKTKMTTKTTMMTDWQCRNVFQPVTPAEWDKIRRQKYAKDDDNNDDDDYNHFLTHLWWCTGRWFEC